MSEATTAELEKRTRALVGECIQRLIAERRLTVEEAPKAIARAVADLSFLEELKMRPVLAPIGKAEPLIMSASAEPRRFNGKPSLPCAPVGGIDAAPPGADVPAPGL